MNEEFFDVVDENGNRTGEKISRTEAHAKGIWHRTVHIYFFRKVDGSFSFLVHLRSKSKDQSPNMWITRFGGHVLAGTQVDEAVRRELEEEVGLDVGNYTVLKGVVTKHDHHPNREFTHSFFIEVPEDVPVKFNDGEVQRVEWMASKDIITSMQTKSRPWAGSLQGFQDTLQVLQRYRR